MACQRTDDISLEEYVRLSKEAYKGISGRVDMPAKAQVELYENTAFMNEYGYYGKASLAESHEVSLTCHLSQCLDSVCFVSALADSFYVDPRRKAYNTERLLRQSQGV